MEKDTLSIVDKITTKTGEIATKIEKSTVSTLDEFITKYEPAISSKLGDMWEYFKATSKSAFEAYYKYLLVRESFPILLATVGLIIGYFIYKKIAAVLPPEEELFELKEINDKMSYSERDSIKSENFYTRMEMVAYKTAPLAVYLLIVFITINNILPNLYNLTQLIVAPEAKVMLELYQLLKK